MRLHRKFEAFGQECKLLCPIQSTQFDCSSVDESYLHLKNEFLNCPLLSNLRFWGESSYSLGVDSDRTEEKKPCGLNFFWLDFLSEFDRFFTFLSEYVFLLLFKFLFLDLAFFVLKYIGIWVKFSIVLSAELKLFALELWAFVGDMTSFDLAFSLIIHGPFIMLGLKEFWNIEFLMSRATLLSPLGTLVKLFLFFG